MPINMIIDGFLGNPAIDAFTDGFLVAFNPNQASYQPLSVSFPYFGASGDTVAAYTQLPLLMLAGAETKPLLGITFNFSEINSEGQLVTYLKWELENAQIATFQVTAGPTGSPYVTISFVWQTMRVTTYNTSTGYSGGTGTTAAFSW